MLFIFYQLESRWISFLDQSNFWGILGFLRWGHNGNPSSMCVCAVSPGWMQCSDWSERKDNYLYSNNQHVKYMCTHSRGHNIVMNRAIIGMSADVAWLPDFCHIVASIFEFLYWVQLWPIKVLVLVNKSLITTFWGYCCCCCCWWFCSCWYCCCCCCCC